MAEEEAQRLHEVAMASESLVSQQLVDPAKAAEVIREAVSPRSGSKSPRPRVSFDGSPTDNGAGAIAFAPAASGGSPARALDHGAMVQLKEQPTVQPKEQLMVQPKEQHQLCKRCKRSKRHFHQHNQHHQRY